MRLKLTLRDTGNTGQDFVVDAEAHTLVSSIAAWVAVRRNGDRLASSAGVTIAVDRSGRSEVLRPDLPLGESGLRSGDVVALTQASAYSATPQAHAATVRVIAGPDVGQSFDIPGGSSNIGRERDCAVRLRDPLVSKHHARLNVTEVIEVVDTQSSNGVIVAGETVSRVVVGPDDQIVLGDTVLVVNRVSGAADVTSGILPFNRSPWLDPRYPGVKLVAPEPPQPPQPQRLPISMLIMPVLMGGVLFAITKNITSVLFVAMSPLMMIGNWFENRVAGKRQFAEAVAGFHDSLADLVVQMQHAGEREQAGRRHEHPETREVVGSALSRHPLLWARRPDRPSFLDVRLGLGTQPSRNSIETTASRRTTPELWNELVGVVERFATIDRVPVVGDLLECRALGISGPEPSCRDAARGLLAQLAGLHSPAEVMIAAVLPAGALPHWSWLKWLPHVDSEHSPLGVDQLASSGPAAAALIARLEEIIASRSELLQQPGQRFPTSVVVLIEQDAPIERPRLVSVAENGPAVGIYTIWVGASTNRLPALCGKFLEIDHNTRQSGIGSVTDGSFVTPVEVGFLGVDDAALFARSLAPLVDAGALLDESGELPSAVSFANEFGMELLDDPAAVVERWRQSQSISREAVDGVKRDRNLRAYVGVNAVGPMMLDLRAHGPHALVGGTTGAGKSEFLQTWLLGMAAAHSSERINFLLVDYKGGSAFGECATLPHSVGLVTDLTPRLVRRALISLRAELTRREHVLNEWSAKDLVDLESKERDGAPVLASLVIVVDEFAALIQEIPEFVDGMIDIAQRGRSLGLHLVLATQRPSGVIKGNLRANTNLRVALRMADADDSADVIGTNAAAAFDPSIPGRAIAKTGPGKVIPFQTAYVGGRTTGEPPPPKLRCSDLPFGIGTEWDAPAVAVQAARDPGPKDIDRLARSISQAARLADLPEPRRPWLPELADRYELSLLPTRRTDDVLVFAVQDDPRLQRQVECAFEPDRDGNLAAFGTGGSGKSTLLRTLAIAAGISIRGGPTAVYGLDFGSRGLSMLAALPHVGAIVAGDDDERVARVIRQLRDTVDERAVRYAAVNAGSIGEYRRLANAPDETRVLLLVDNVGSFRTAYELGPRSRVFEAFQSIAMDGRALGVHVVLSADRPSSVPASLMSVIPRRMALRLADDMDLSILGVSADAFDAGTPAGRAYLDGAEIQIAVLGGADASISSQAAAIGELAAEMRGAKVADAPGVERLAERVLLSELPVTFDGWPVIGVSDASLGPQPFRTGDAFVVCGPPQSGKSTTVLTLVESLRRWKPSLKMIYLGNRRSPTGAQPVFSERAFGPDDVAELAQRLTEGFRSESLDPAEHVVVIESIGDFLQSAADLELQDLIKVARVNGATVITEAETSVIIQSWPLYKEARASRHGIVLQPDQMDGDNLFGTTFSRMTRAEFPEGRGMYVRTGRATRVQVAIPE